MFCTDHSDGLYGKESAAFNLPRKSGSFVGQDRYFQPLAPDHLDVFLPGTVAPGQDVRATLSVRDQYDNRVAYNGPVTVRLGGTETSATIMEGLSRFSAGAMGDEPLQLIATCPELGLSDTFAANVCLPAGDMNLYFGDLHAHDSGSTAEGYPADVYLWARDEKRLDFLSVPIQMHRWLDNEKWCLIKHFNEYFLDEGRFVTFLAFEWQHSSCGDKVIHYLGGDQPFLPIDDARYDSPEKLYAALEQSDALVVSHHPGYELDRHVPGTRWEVVDDRIDRLLEIWSMHGSSEGCDSSDRPLMAPRRSGGACEGLRGGLRMGVVAGSDTHTGRPAGSIDDCRSYHGGLCAVWAQSLTRRAMWEAFHSRRTYALTGARIALRFAVNGAPMGSEIPAAATCELSAEVWAPAEVAKVQFLRNAEIFHEESVGANDCRVEYDDARPDDAPALYHCRVIQTDGHLSVSSPVWVG